MREPVTSERKLLVTGASSGIGAAIAVELARQGHAVGCASLRETVPQGEGSLIPMPLDVTDSDAVAGAVDKLVASAGPLAGLVHAAGRYSDAPAVTIGMDEVRSVFETNLFPRSGSPRSCIPTSSLPGDSPCSSVPCTCSWG